MNNYPCFQNVSLSLSFYSFFSVCSWSVSFPSGSSFKIWMLFSFQILLSFYILPHLCNLFSGLWSSEDLGGSKISICGLNLFIKFQVHICTYTLNISTSTSHRLDKSKMHHLSPQIHSLCTVYLASDSTCTRSPKWPYKKSEHSAGEAIWRGSETTCGGRGPPSSAFQPSPSKHRAYEWRHPGPPDQTSQTPLSWSSQHHVEQNDHPAETCSNSWPTISWDTLKLCCVNHWVLGRLVTQ